MKGLHVTQEDFEAVERGELTVEEINRRYRQHARALCPICRREHEEFLRRRRLWGRAQWLSLLLALLREVLARWELEKAAGEQELGELMALPPPERQRRVSRARKRFRTSHLAEALLGQSRARTFEDPAEARSLARLAFHVALRFDQRHQDDAPAFRIRALAAESNALRCLGRLRDAGQTMDFVLESIDEIAENEERAEVLSLAASLRRTQRRFAESRDLIDRAVGLYERLGDRHLLGRCLLTKSVITRQAGDLERALEVVEKAVALLDARRDPRCHLFASHERACLLTDSGKPDQARRLLRRLAPLYDRFPDPATQLRRRWLEGRIAQGLEETTEAERAFTEVRDGFVAIGNGYDAALVSLDLAVLYADLDRPEEMQRLAREMIPIFRAQDVHREALAALLVFCNAAGREAVSHDLLRRLTDYLHRARHDRELRFES